MSEERGRQRPVAVRRFPGASDLGDHAGLEDRQKRTDNEIESV